MKNTINNYSSNSDHSEIPFNEIFDVLKSEWKTWESMNLLTQCPVEFQNKLQKYIDNHLFTKTGSELINQVVESKKRICKQVLWLDMCPFEEVTKWYSRENLIRKNICLVDEDNSVFTKTLNPWLHLIVRSDILEERKEFVYNNRHDSNFIHYRYRTVWEEHVEIDWEHYMLWEANIDFFRKNLEVETDNKDPYISLINSAIVIDKKILNPLYKQENHQYVLKMIYAIYHLSSHDLFLHWPFNEWDKFFRNKIKKSDVAQLTNVYFLCYDTFEINYVRMMKAIWESSCNENKELVGKLYKLIRLFLDATKDRPDLLKKYFMYNFNQRLYRLSKTDYIIYNDVQWCIPYFKMWKWEKRIEINLSNDNYFDYMLHSNNQKEVLFHKDENDLSIVWEIKYNKIAELFDNLYNEILTLKN